MPDFINFTPEFLQTPEGVAELNRLLNVLNVNVAGDTESVRVYSGYGSPESVVTAGMGSLYLNLSGGTDTTLYKKESGTGATGWIAVTTPTFPLSVANGGTGSDLSATAQGNIFYFSAAGVISVLGPGTSGYFLKTQGAGANPVWAAAIPAYAAGDYLIGGPTLFNTANPGGSYTKVGEIYVPRSGTLRTKFWLLGATDTMYGRVYRNDSAVGTEQTAASGTGMHEYSEDIAGWSVGDLCQLYVKSNATTGNYGNLRLYEATPTRELDAAKPVFHYGTAAPDGSLGSIGDLYVDKSGGATTTLYVKTGASTWTAK